MPWRDFRILARMLGRESENSEDIRLLRSFATCGLLWLILTELVLIAGDYPAALMANVLVHRKANYLAGLSQVEAIAAIAFLALAANILLGLINLKMGNERNKFEHKLWDLLMKTGSRHLVRLDTAWHTEMGTGEKENLLNKNYQRLWHLIDQLIFGTIPSAIRDILIACGLFLLDWRFALLAIAMIGAYGAMVNYSHKELMEMSEEYREEMEAAEKYSSQTTDRVHEVKSLGLGEYRYNSLRDLTGQLYQSELTRHLRWAYVLFRQDVILAVGSAATIAVAYLSYQNGLSIGGVVLGIGCSTP
jgi:ABC-type bacteriocin/lantibiotic exporter with double-glycine peptidase domain